MKYYAVIGRLCGDNEDTLHIIEAEDADKAQAIWQERILNENGYDSLEDWWQACRAWGNNFSEDDSGIYLNEIVESDSPIRSVYSALWS
jgi:hypothetical protein